MKNNNYNDPNSTCGFYNTTAEEILLWFENKNSVNYCCKFVFSLKWINISNFDGGTYKNTVQILIKDTNMFLSKEQTYLQSVFCQYTSSLSLYQAILPNFKLISKQTLISLRTQ